MTGALSAEFPTKVVALILNVYAVPATKVFTMAVVTTFTATTLTTPASVYVIVYPVIGRPPVFAGATQVSEALLDAAVPAKAVGTPGRVAAMTALERPPALAPMLLADWTENT